MGVRVMVGVFVRVGVRVAVGVFDGVGVRVGVGEIIGSPRVPVTRRVKGPWPWGRNSEKMESM